MQVRDSTRRSGFQTSSLKTSTKIGGELRFICKQSLCTPNYGLHKCESDIAAMSPKNAKTNPIEFVRQKWWPRRTAIVVTNAENLATGSKSAAYVAAKP